jgi:uncharacterized damage-inducible protein DinB
MDTNGLILAVKTSRERWESALAGIEDARLLEPGVAGAWSLKDIIAHITWFEREMIEVVTARALVGSDYWQFPPDERNAIIYKENRDRSLDEVRMEAKLVFGVLLDALATLTDDELIDPARFEGMPPDWVPLEIIAQNTFEHYEAHRVGVEGWLGT